LLRQRKVPKRKATPSLRPLRFATGQTCGGAVAECAVELALRWRAPLRHPRRVRARCTRAPTRVPPHNHPAAGAASRGGATEHPTAEHPYGPLLRSAVLAQREALAPARWGRAKQRPVWMFCSPGPSGCAEERRVWRIRARVCLSDAQRRELSETPPNPSTAGCPVAKRRGRRQWGRLSFGYFSLAKQRKVPRLPGDYRPPPSTKARGPISTPHQNTTKSIATTAYPTSACGHKGSKTSNHPFNHPRNLPTPSSNLPRS